MTDEQNMPPELPNEELEAQPGEELPDREAMSLINANLAASVNAAVAANVLSDDSIADAHADRHVEIDQPTDAEINRP